MIVCPARGLGLGVKFGARLPAVSPPCRTSLLSASGLPDGREGSGDGGLVLRYRLPASGLWLGVGCGGIRQWWIAVGCQHRVEAERRNPLLVGLGLGLELVGRRVGHSVMVGCGWMVGCRHRVGAGRCNLVLVGLC